MIRPALTMLLALPLTGSLAVAQRAFVDPLRGNITEHSVQFLDDRVRIPGGRYDTFDLELWQKAATIDGQFVVLPAGTRVRIALLRKEELDRYSGESGFAPLFSTRFLEVGYFHYSFQEPGSYVLLVDNRQEKAVPVEVTIRASLTFRTIAPLKPGVVSPARRAVVIGASVLFFLLVAAFSAGRLRRAAMRRYARMHGLHPPS